MPGESHGQSSLVGYSPQCCNKLGHDSNDLACAHPDNREEKVRGKNPSRPTSSWSTQVRIPERWFLFAQGHFKHLMRKRMEDPGYATKCSTAELAFRRKEGRQLSAFVEAPPPWVPFRPCGSPLSCRSSYQPAALHQRT